MLIKHIILTPVIETASMMSLVGNSFKSLISISNVKSSVNLDNVFETNFYYSSQGLLDVIN